MIELYREAFRLGFKSKKIGITSSWPDEALGAFIKMTSELQKGKNG